MSSVTSIGNSATALQLLSGQTSNSRPSDGDTAAKEAAESAATKLTEVQNGGRAPNVVNKTA
jgi:hypothetical protein